MNLAYTCVKPLVRLYVCQRVAFFMTHFGSIWVHFGFWIQKRSFWGSFWVHLGSIWGSTDSCLNTDASLGVQGLGFESVFRHESGTRQEYSLDKNTSLARTRINAFADTRINAFADTRKNAFGDTRMNVFGDTRISAFGVWGRQGPDRRISAFGA